MAVTPATYGLHMDVVLGLLFWGGLLALTLVWIARTGLTGSRRHRQAPAQTSRPHDSPTAWSSTAPPATPRHAGPPAAAQRRQVRDAQAQRLREDEALADGLVIGHFLTRDHYRRELANHDAQLDQAAAAQQRWEELAGLGDELDDVHGDLDYAEFDAMGGFGVEPWADDLFDHGHDDEL